MGAVVGVREEPSRLLMCESLASSTIAPEIPHEMMTAR